MQHPQQFNLHTQNLEHFLQPLVGFGPARVGFLGDGIHRVAEAHHAAGVVDNELERGKLRQHHELVGQADGDFVFGLRGKKNGGGKNDYEIDIISKQS